ncbi:putative Thermitase [Arthrobacter sp. 9AX]|uniref:S8 family peptidase n=1 Tax=Arthrobacter sp. 9AX TaxID=2653131 RepID=UPI0012F1C7DD|nr:S8 family peptidase [Arthrobacter sp. 9AX]VXB54274.1 putative Thermitase [Arthrobacter sp. 9AX]
MPNRIPRSSKLPVLGLTLSAILASVVMAVPAHADANLEVRKASPRTGTAQATATDQFIVGLKTRPGIASEAAATAEAARTAAAGLGVAAQRVRGTATGAQVVRTSKALPAAEAETFLAALRANPQVEYAEPDVIMHTQAAEPNDPGYAVQWGLWEEPAGVRIPGAWDVNRGEGAVVAVVDTGITSHYELNGKVLPGYDMMSDAVWSRDGGGRDANPQDEGDWTTAGQCDPGTPESISSWHGTHVAGIIAATANNNDGISGVAPEAKILPIRAIGACGGYSSDIADSIVWAAGGQVAGVPANPNRANVINLSLGGLAPCSATQQAAINFAHNAGSAVVVAAGNSTRPAADVSPANCQNVITVAAAGRNGGRAPYSNYGAAVDVTAPGGDLSGDDYRAGILSTSNFGSTTPETEAYEYLQGTSMAAPHVAGIAALMMSEIGGTYTPAAVEQRLKATARPTAIACTEGCGAGLVDATKALNFSDADLPANTVRPAAVTFSDKDGTAQDTFTVPTSQGVEYLAGGTVVPAGVRPGAGTVTVSARALPGYILVAGAASQWSKTYTATYAPVPGSLIPVTPFRALDTRNSSAVAPDSTVSFQVAGQGGVPAKVSSVVFNMTVAEAQSFGFVTAYASGAARPDASNMNFSSGQIVANAVTVPVGADGKVTLFNRSAGATHLLADVSGYYLPGIPTAAGAFQPIAPSRFLDTRSGAPVASDSSISFQVAGVDGVPGSVSAVVLNLTVAEAKSFGFITAHASGTDRPNASNVNFGPGQIIPNSVTVPVGKDGRVTLFNRSSGTTHLLADVSGYYMPGTPLAGGTFQPIAPTRFLDTRAGYPVRADNSTAIQMTGEHGIPAGASAVVFNLTVAEANSFGFVTAYPMGPAMPNASNINFSAGQIVPNSVTVPIGSFGKVILFNRSSAANHYVADVSGYFLPG